MARKRERLIEIILDEASLSHYRPEVAQERAVAIFDLLESNQFAVVGHDGGPYRLKLYLQEDRLRFEIRDRKGDKLRDVALSLRPFRTLIKDYFTLCASYYNAIKHLSPSQIEAIDMGRRGLHDEAAAILRERLGSKIAVDEATSRRLFTLICVLHVRDARQ